MRKLKGFIIAAFLLAVCAGISSQAAGYKTVTGDMKKNGSYYMWIDGQRCLHIRRPSKKRDLAAVTGCDGGISNGKMIYYIRKSGRGAWVCKYSISSKTGETIDFMKGVTGIIGVYGNRLILNAENGIIGMLYAYDMNTGKMKRISYSCECAGMYKQYFVFEGLTGAVNPVQVGVYNAKTNTVKTLTKKSWYMIQNGKQIYYAKEVGSTSSYVVRKLKIYRYTMTTGKSKALSR